MVSCTGGDPLPLVHRVRGWEESYNDGKELPIVPVKVGGTLALRIIADGWPYFHVVPLRKNCRPSRWMLGSMPDIGTIRGFLANLPDLPPVPKPNPEVPRDAAANMPFAQLLLWMKATQDLKQIRKIRHNKLAWAAVFAQGDRAEIDRLDRNAAEVSYDTMRRARVRLDMTCCLAFRDYWRKLLEERTPISICVYTDGSPQWRGKELIATTVELHTQPFSEAPFTMMLPLIHIGSDLLKSSGKLFALLWQVFLVVGPVYTRLRKFTEAIVSFTTDLGTERMLSSMPDLLGEFCRHVCIPVPASARDRLRAFPRSVLAPGWHHIWDGLVQRGLNSLAWFPSYLASLKVLLAFLRNHMPDIQLDLAREGRGAAAYLLVSQRLPTFAQWRWSTLNYVVRAISAVYNTSNDNFEQLRFVERMRNRSTLK